MIQRGALIALAALALGACSARIVPPGAPAPTDPIAAPQFTTPLPAIPVAAPVTTALNARAAGAIAGTPIAALPIAQAQAERALKAFQTSCPALIKRNDSSGLTRGADWAAACAAAPDWNASDAPGFFRRYFETVQIGTGAAHATGYFEPEIAGSRTRGAGYDVPVYRKPGDLVDVDLGLFSEDLKGKKVRGRVEKGALVPYYQRSEIVDGALADKGLELAWAADPVEFFFLQIQGSGRLKLPDGSVMRIGYDNQNGRGYTGIGKLLLDRGLVPKGQASMQGIMSWLRANPEQGRAVMDENKSFVFFRELTGAGPLGAMGLPVAGGASVATDPDFTPLGAPVFLSLDRAEAAGIWVAQDVGGAIKGANRFDTFWGAGARARAIAGGMSGRGTAFLLLPIGTVARLNAESGHAGPSARR
ncbi:membrane-bound lytic murein transglycosylase A [Sphingobium boeckii]|uniref:peptidoglycan lytic exotransglycosylase n=1 Tax=Sphingobium boeckii TaxID=1082345 RepID=A0A7W9AGG7_9SPHN|nr:membrane-bound lytic murein transglycosylase A [Sphingobium boeckii]